MCHMVLSGSEGRGRRWLLLVGRAAGWLAVTTNSHSFIAACPGKKVETWRTDLLLRLIVLDSEGQIHLVDNLQAGALAQSCTIAYGMECFLKLLLGQNNIDFSLRVHVYSSGSTTTLPAKAYITCFHVRVTRSECRQTFCPGSPASDGASQGNPEQDILPFRAAVTVLGRWYRCKELPELRGGHI
ncbi:hypothetical protein EYF80_004435 [Liparis tanakae]|uniref:Uncharacterized protein n=1 Tax=Liparis tanakae TaxID=230148 RepID=A0A4Z2J761_9TELE|nr:hypothetical protein EYF80_004435 [Liparis tanakae]